MIKPKVGLNFYQLYVMHSFVTEILIYVYYVQFVAPAKSTKSSIPQSKGSSSTDVSSTSTNLW